MIRMMFAAAVSSLALASAIPASAQDVPTMDFGIWGVDPDAIDESVNPGDNFFDYVNAKWLADNPIPPEFTRFGAFDLLREKSTSDVEKLIADLLVEKPEAGTAGARIIDAYQAYLDKGAIDAAGLAPAYPFLSKIYAAQDLEALVGLFAEAGYPSFVSMSVSVDAKDPTSYGVSIGFGGMGLASRDYYLVDSERNLEIREKYTAHLAFLLGKAGYADPELAAAQVFHFETMVAELEWDRTMIRNRDLTYNRVSREELAEMGGGFPVETMIAAYDFGGETSFLVSQIPPTDEEVEELGLTNEDLDKIGGGLPAMMQLLAKMPLANLKAYMAAQFLSGYSSILPSDIEDAEFEFFGKFMGGQEEQRPRWKRAISSTEGMLGEQLGALYVERYFPPEAKAQMDELVANLRKAMAASLEENTWMSADTKVQAVTKLDAFNPKIGYPTEFETYDGLDIIAGNPLANSISATKWAVADNHAKLGQPVDKTEWGMLPQTVNAYFNPVFNEIVFPAAILQAPFFNPDADPAVNYGGIGAVIGHEMSHGFDDQGAKYDFSGTLKNWWADADLKEFTKLGDKLAAQYDGFCPYDEDETCVNGRFTLGENIGDVGGLSMSYRAYRMSLNGEEAPVIDGFTGDQRFFLSWAQVWRAAQREDAGRQRLLTDPHSPPFYRVNGVVRNNDAWYKAFGITKDDALYLSPEERVLIW